jgi:hypothetical protein
MDYAAWLLKQDWHDPAVAAKLRAAIADYDDDRHSMARTTTSADRLR